MQDVYVVCNIGGIYKHDTGAWTTFCATSTAFGDLAVSPDGSTIFGVTYTTTPNMLYASSSASCNFVLLGTYNVNYPAALSSLSDGRILMSDQGGAIYVVNPDGTGFVQWGSSPIGWTAIGDFLVVNGTLYGAFYDNAGGGGGSRLWSITLNGANQPSGAWVNVMAIQPGSTGLAQDCDGNIFAPNSSTGMYDILDPFTGTISNSGILLNCSFVWGLGSACDGGSSCTLTSDPPIFGNNLPAIPILSSSCPDSTVDLLSLNSSITNVPLGASISWHDADPPAATNEVSIPSAVISGVYYVAFKENTPNCYSGAIPVLVTTELCNPCPPNLCVEAILGNLDICPSLNNDPSHPVGPLDCDGDGVTNANECTDSTDPLDPCDFVDTSITLPVTADQSDCPFPCPDLTPIMTILPGNIAGMSSVEVAVQVTELDSVHTNGSIIVVRVPSDPRLIFVWNIGLTLAALVPVQNADWNYLGDNGFVHTWTYNGPGLIIPADGTAAFGFQSFYDPQSTDGQTTLTATIIPFSGGECNALNNTDSERLVYFE